VKVIKLSIAGLAALWTIGVAAGFVSNIGQHGGTRGTVEFAAGIGSTAACIAITYWLFQWALKQPTTPPDN
jgi:hypothetical protein